MRRRRRGGVRSARGYLESPKRPGEPGINQVAAPGPGWPGCGRRGQAVPARRRRTGPARARGVERSGASPPDGVEGEPAALAEDDGPRKLEKEAPSEADGDDRGGAAGAHRRPSLSKPRARLRVGGPLGAAGSARPGAEGHGRRDPMTPAPGADDDGTWGDGPKDGRDGAGRRPPRLNAGPETDPRRALPDASVAARRGLGDPPCVRRRPACPLPPARRRGTPASSQGPGARARPTAGRSLPPGTRPLPASQRPNAPFRAPLPPGNLSWAGRTCRWSRGPRGYPKTLSPEIPARAPGTPARYLTRPSGFDPRALHGCLPEPLSGQAAPIGPHGGFPPPPSARSTPSPAEGGRPVPGPPLRTAVSTAAQNGGLRKPTPTTFPGDPSAWYLPNARSLARSARRRAHPGGPLPLPLSGLRAYLPRKPSAGTARRRPGLSPTPCRPPWSPFPLERRESGPIETPAELLPPGLAPPLKRRCERHSPARLRVSLRTSQRQAAGAALSRTPRRPPGARLRLALASRRSWGRRQPLLRRALPRRRCYLVPRAFQTSSKGRPPALPFHGRVRRRPALCRNPRRPPGALLLLALTSRGSGGRWEREAATGYFPKTVGDLPEPFAADLRRSVTPTWRGFRTTARPDVGRLRQARGSSRGSCRLPMNPQAHAPAVRARGQRGADRDSPEIHADLLEPFPGELRESVPIQTSVPSSDRLRLTRRNASALRPPGVPVETRRLSGPRLGKEVLPVHQVCRSESGVLSAPGSSPTEGFSGAVGSPGPRSTSASASALPPPPATSRAPLARGAPPRPPGGRGGCQPPSRAGRRRRRSLPPSEGDKSLCRGLTFNRSQRGSCSATHETLTQNQVVYE
ncbi:collagen alpha-1(II) chain-like [Rhineura floridana]|uniref:collagen alpha-1(II) chain-like n=1 Tax=Rhineura floridana TaxID=261503 RepID=UPI002AC874EC|nr:collagen alpha-1(II) chain-like [Rhineura floridana]XP_061462964.1 collagen alpha-1(II) chain-like [Rhineura floridana]